MCLRGLQGFCIPHFSRLLGAISVSPTSANLAVGATQQLTATVSPNNATNKNVTWSSSDDGVATVNASGLVTAQAVGTATITVTTDDGGFTATTTVTVIAVPTGSAVILSKASGAGMPTSEVKVEIESSPVNQYTLYFDGQPLASTTNGIVTIATAVLNDLSRVQILYNSSEYSTIDGGSW